MNDSEYLKRLLEIRENFAEMYAEMLKGGDARGLSVSLGMPTGRNSETA
jgi:hypothetical protein